MELLTSNQSIYHDPGNTGPAILDSPAADISEGLLICHPTIRILIGRIPKRHLTLAASGETRPKFCDSGIKIYPRLLNRMQDAGAPEIQTGGNYL